MRISIVCIAILTILLPSTGLSQDQPVNVRDLHRSRFSLVMGGINLVGVGFDIFLTNRLNLELSAGLGVGAGLRYHPKGSDPSVRWSPYAGAYAGMITFPDLQLFGESSGGECRPNIYIPAGVHYISTSGRFSIALEVGYMHAFSNDEHGSLDIPLAGIKIHLVIPSISLW